VGIAALRPFRDPGGQGRLDGPTAGTAHPSAAAAGHRGGRAVHRAIRSRGLEAAAALRSRRP